MVTSICEENTVVIDFLAPTSLPGQYRRPQPKDEVPVECIYIFAGPLLPPIPTSGGRLFTLPQEQQAEETYKKFKER